METKTLSPATGRGVLPSPADPPPFRCPHCRIEHPVIKYGELIYSSQVYTSSEEDWEINQYGDADGSYYISAECRNCERDIVHALIRYNAKHPGQQYVPADFCHECSIPRGLPLPKRSRVVRQWGQLDDHALQERIDHLRTALGYLLDEQNRRSVEKATARQRAQQAPQVQP